MSTGTVRENDMKWLSLTLFAMLATCAPAYADMTNRVMRDVEVWDHPQHVAEVVFSNTTIQWAEGKYYRTFERNGVTMVVEIEITKNLRCTPSCPDWMRVIDVTPGFMAYPAEIEIPENGEGAILIMEATVG